MSPRELRLQKALEALLPMAERQVEDAAESAKLDEPDIRKEVMAEVKMNREAIAQAKKLLGL